MTPFTILRQTVSAIFGPSIGKDEITQVRLSERISVILSEMLRDTVIESCL